ncbi:unnamed protein product [Allacma fusca]|uniref:Uncharacterized protein n=1 Tax=Allacma fusca TaxID=39272 RepID=A0A8J2JXU4_9HEXA|nr:unnamed protein product [Allacma fusca]
MNCTNYTTRNYRLIDNKLNFQHCYWIFLTEKLMAPNSAVLKFIRIFDCRLSLLARTNIPHSINALPFCTQDEERN